MQKNIHVLVFPCGKENALEVHNALNSNVGITVFGASSVADHGELVYENYIGGLPFIQDSTFLHEFNKVILQCEIDVIIPTHDTVSLFLAGIRNDLKARLAAPSLSAVETCRSKQKTYSSLRGFQFVPEWWFGSLPDILSFPLFAKPDAGEGSRDTRILHSIEDLTIYFPSTKGFVFCEFLPGPELTVDCFTDRHGKMLFCGPRTRERVVAGITQRSRRYELSDEILFIANSISETIGMRGLWYFQLKQDHAGKWKLMEVSCRTSGTMTFYRFSGINFPLLTVFDLMGRDVTILYTNLNVVLERSLKTRFIIPFDYDVVYLDYDDTVIIRDRVNTHAISSIYHWRSMGKRLILLTHHAGNLNESLRSYCIDSRLFDEIIQLPPNQPKSTAIQNGNAILIDNAFQIRQEVKNTCGIPVFDADCLEFFHP